METWRGTSATLVGPENVSFTLMEPEKVDWLFMFIDLLT